MWRSSWCEVNLDDLSRVSEKEGDAITAAFTTRPSFHVKDAASPGIHEFEEFGS